MHIRWLTHYIVKAGVQMKVLIVDDDEKLQNLLKKYLSGYGWAVISLLEGKRTLDAIKEHSPHIVILDIMLPDRDGLRLLTTIRRQYTLPVLMLTARGEDADRIVGLELGADDYLPKPFNPRELVARMKAVLRRQNAGSQVTNEDASEHTITHGELVLYRARQTISRGEKEIELSTTEFKIMEALMISADVVLSRDQLMQSARGRDMAAFDRSIDVHISRLRAKLEAVSDNPDRTRTMWGSGYMFLKKQCE